MPCFANVRAPTPITPATTSDEVSPCSPYRRARYDSTRLISDALNSRLKRMTSGACQSESSDDQVLIVRGTDNDCAFAVRAAVFPLARYRLFWSVVRSHPVGLAGAVPLVNQPLWYATPAVPSYCPVSQFPLVDVKIRRLLAPL